MSPVKAKMRPGQTVAHRNPWPVPLESGSLAIGRPNRPPYWGVPAVECHAFNLNLHVERVKLPTPKASFPSVKAGTAWLGSLGVCFCDHLCRPRGDSLHFRVTVAAQAAIPQLPNESFLFLDFCFGI